MSAEIKIPAVGESITSGLISAWHKQEGETVAAGDPLFTLETDKVSTEVTAPAPGSLRIKVAAGEEVKIGQVVGSIEEQAAGAASAPAAPAAPEAARQMEATPVPQKGPEKAVETGKTAPAEVASPTAAPRPPQELASPGRILEGGPEPLSRESVRESSPAKDASGRTVRKRMSPIRRKIAAQLVMAQQTAAILTTFNECDLSAIIRLRSELQESFSKQHGVKLGFMSFFLKAAVSALKAAPAINSRLDGEDLVQNNFYDIGVAVGTERGLLVPVIREADRKTFAEIEKEIAAFATKARENKITTEDLQGGVFTISNGGIYGSLLSTPILNPPQSGILGMHKIQERPMAVAGQVVIRPMMYLALSYDHRVVDGREAVTFLIRVKESIENPGRLLVEG